MKSKVSHNIKLERMQSQILEYLGELIHSEVKDPRVSKLTSIVRVEVAHDLKFAKVYISTLGSDEDRKRSIEGLNSAKGYLRMRLSRIMGTKIAPEINFVNDTSIEYAAYIQQKLETLNIVHSENGEEKEEEDDVQI